MKRKSMENLGPLQKVIMDVVWDLGEATGRQIQARIQKKKKKIAYTSVMTIMRRLEKAGWLKHRQEGQTYFYQPTSSQGQEKTRTVRKVIDLIYQGESRLLFEHLIEEDDLSDEDLSALRKIIDDKRKEKKNG